MRLQIHGIPTCGTCKKAIKWLNANEINFEFINTKEHPPSRNEIEQWVKSLTAKAMRNTSGRSYRELGAQKQTWQDKAWIEAFATDAMLLKRPIFVKDGVAVMVGFRENDAAIKLLNLD